MPITLDSIRLSDGFEYLAVVRLRALIAQEAGVEQAKAQEVTLKRAIEGPSSTSVAAGDELKEKDNACRALVKAGEITSQQMLIPATTSTEAQGPRRGAKTIKALILLCVSRPALIGREDLIDMKPPTGSSGHQAQKRRRWDSQSLVRLAGRFIESHSAAFVMRLRSGDTGGHMLPAGPDYWLRRWARLVA